MTTSILHRATGLVLSVGFIVLTGWIFIASIGANFYVGFLEIMGSALGRVLLVGWSFAFFFHLSNGIRHLVWDSGRGFEKSTADASAWFVLVLTVILTTLFWWARS